MRYEQTKFVTSVVETLTRLQLLGSSHIEKSAVRTRCSAAGYSVRSKKLNKDPSPVVTSLASDWKVEKDLFLERRDS
jgi:hypothetical protein